MNKQEIKVYDLKDLLPSVQDMLIKVLNKANETKGIIYFSDFAIKYDI